MVLSDFDCEILDSGKEDRRPKTEVASIIEFTFSSWHFEFLLARKKDFQIPERKSRKIDFPDFQMMTQKVKLFLKSFALQ